MQTENLEGQESIFGRDSGFGKMSSALSQVGGTLKRVKKSLGRIFKKSSKRSSKLKNHTFMLLDLRPDAGNMLGAYWEYDPPWLGSFGTLNTSECPKDAVECSLWRSTLRSAPKTPSSVPCGRFCRLQRHPDTRYPRQRAWVSCAAQSAAANRCHPYWKQLCVCRQGLTRLPLCSVKRKLIISTNAVKELT